MRELKIELSFAVGGIKNHEIYFEHLGGDGGDPTDAISQLIERDFGSFAAWREDLKASGMAGRGWAWTAYDWDEGRLFNYVGDAQNTFPIWNATPLVALDVYEHAYFLDYRTDRASYIDAFFDNLNKAVEGTEWDGRPIEQVLGILDELPEDKRTVVRNNGGGHTNHTLFWEIMAPNGGGEPSGALGDAINSTFGGLDALKEAVNDAGVKRFGSGWTWLIHDGTGLAVVSTPNQDSPLSDGQTPILGIDVWEHAYYLKYQNRRPDYLAAWWNVVNWDSVQRRYEAAGGS